MFTIAPILAANCANPVYDLPIEFENLSACIFIKTKFVIWGSLTADLSETWEKAIFTHDLFEFARKMTVSSEVRLL